MAHLAYELSFKGAASDALAAAFDHALVTTRHGVTTIRTELPDQAALQGVIGRIHALGLELLEVRLVADAASEDLAWLEGP
jgi:hypothetical protein